MSLQSYTDNHLRAGMHTTALQVVHVRAVFVVVLFLFFVFFKRKGKIFMFLVELLLFNPAESSTLLSN